jgi:hypothetical protein
MDMLFQKIKTLSVYSMVLITLGTSLSVTSCGGRDMDTQSDRNFDNEETLPQTNSGDTTAPVGIRADSTPAAHPDQDDNPVIDKGMSTDSAMRAERERKQ